MKLLEVGQVIDLSIRRNAKELTQLGNDRLEGMSWLNNKFYEIKKLNWKTVPANQVYKGLVKQADQFAEFYVVFMQNSEKFFDKADEYVNNISNSDLPDNIYNELQAVIMSNVQNRLEFTQTELENLFDAVSTQMTPNMSQAISQRANKHYKSSIKNESFYDNLWGRPRT